jgi:MiaB/RimO family radical SAM methylthiotransferase
MLSRISFLFENKGSGAKLFVFGCLSAARGAPIKKISEKITVLDTNLESLCRALKIKPKKFSPEMKSVKIREMISIIPIATGCIGGCSYCITKIARGELHSYSEKEIEVAFKKAMAESMEIWLTSQDLGCYGVDSNSSLPKLLKRLLKNEGDYFVRLGMMNPNHFKKIHKQLMPLFENRRLYKFLHLPVQSGSDRILKAMGRKYSGKVFLNCLKVARASQPNITISTDVIVGFPGETKADFEKTLALLGRAKPDVVNISRFGKRPGTAASLMKPQVQESEKKERSRKISSFCKDLFLEKNKKLVGKEFDALVSEKAGNGFFTARTDCYRPVLVKSCFGKFVRVRITKAYSNFFEGEIVSCRK